MAVQIRVNLAAKGSRGGRHQTWNAVLDGPIEGIDEHDRAAVPWKQRGYSVSGRVGESR